MQTLNRKLFRNLKKLKAQTITTAILIACGVGMLIATSSAHEALKDSRDRFYRDYQFAHLFGDLKRAPLFVADRISTIPGVEAVDAGISIDGLIHLEMKGKGPAPEPAVGRFTSLPEAGSAGLNRLYLRTGRLPHESITPEVVLHEGFASANELHPGDRFGILIQGREERVQVVGIAISPDTVYALSSSAPLPDDRHFGIGWMARADLERLTDMAGSFNHLSVLISPALEGQKGKDSPIRTIKTVKTTIDDILKPYGSPGVIDRSLQSSDRFVENEIEEQRVMALIIPSIFLAIAAFLIQIISSRLIHLERPEIATLKALGYPDRTVTLHYLKLILMMVTIGIVPGIALGGGIGKLLSMSYERFFRFPSIDFSIHPNSALIGILAGILPGLVGSALGLTGIFRLRPAEALKPPVPPSFHFLIFERDGILRKIPVRARMILRNLFARPFRLILSILGISTSLMVMIMVFSWNDMLDYLLVTEFERIERGDLTLGLIKPAPLAVLSDLRTLPGVLDVEGYRSVPVRLKHGQFSREIALTGWPEGAKLAQILDREGRAVRVPREGLLLSRYFEWKWGLKPGDPVRAELLENPERSLSLRVAGFSDDLIGISANLRSTELSRAMDEEPAYNQIRLKIDPKQAIPLFVKLKEIPLIQSVVKRSALYRGFQESMGALIATSTGILTAFALAIALGVIDNSVRVSFSERSWELASLRVLGFQEKDAFRLLLGENAFQTLLAIPIGCLIGYALTGLTIESIHAEEYDFPVVMELKTPVLAIAIVVAAFGASLLSLYRLSKRIPLISALKARE